MLIGVPILSQGRLRKRFHSDAPTMSLAHQAKASLRYSRFFVNTKGPFFYFLIKIYKYISLRSILGFTEPPRVPFWNALFRFLKRRHLLLE